MKMLIFAKIFATLLAILVFARSYNDLKTKRESLFMTVVWFSVWVGILAVAYFPSIVDMIIETGGKKSGLGTLLGLVIAFVLFINYRIYLKAHRVERAMSKLACSVALSSSDKLKKKKSKK